MTGSLELGDIQLNASPDAGSISFIVNGYGEIIKLHPNGDIYIKGKLVVNDMEVIDGFKDFLSMSAYNAQNWEDTARHYADGMEYYRELVDKIGKMLGPDAYISDDGSVQKEILRAKVPELVAAKLGVKLEA